MANTTTEKSNGGIPQHVKDRLALLGSLPAAHEDAQAPTYLRIPVPRRPLDPTVLAALRIVESERRVDVATLAAKWEAQRFATPLSKVTRSLSKRGLRYDERLLLSHPVVYAALIDDQGLTTDAVADTLGYSEALLRKLRDARHGVLIAFYRALAKENAKKSGVVLEDRLELVARKLLERAPGLGPNEVAPVFEEVHEALVAQGSMPRVVDLYLAANDIDMRLAPESVRRRMVDFLLESGIRVDLSNPEQQKRFAWGDYDEHLAVAYARARSQTADVESITPTTGGWDFSIEAFDDVVDIAVEADNILAAGFMDYAHEIGERLHVFDLMDVLYYEWTGGNLDLPQSEAATRLELLWRERDSRDTSEERGLGYMKALGKGSTQALDRMVVNRDFAALWGSLMEEVARYIKKREEASSFGDQSPISRTPVYQATKLLQHNLTEFGNGRTKSQARQLRNLLKACFDVLDAPEVAQAYGTSSRKDRWSIIERLHRLPPFGNNIPNVSAIRTAANDGNRVFQWIATFKEGAVVDDEFDAFLRAAEAWIIAKSSDQGEPEGAVTREETDDFGEDELGDGEFDDFDV